MYYFQRACKEKQKRGPIMKELVRETKESTNNKRACKKNKTVPGQVVGHPV
jgi:hypothetical protein